MKINYNKAEQRWPAFPKEANNDPHAVWWHFNDNDELCEAEKTWGLPSAEILGILMKYEPDNKLWIDCYDKAVRRLEKDESKWNEYSAKPLMFIHGPESPFYTGFKTLTDKNLDWEINRQTSDSCWDPNWEWYRDEDIWSAAKEDWKNFLTAENLMMLKKIDRIEE